MRLKQLIWLLCAGMSLAATALAGTTSTPGSDRKVYEWVDEQGVTHYGDRIPPEYASQEHRVINGHGIEIEHTDAQKTPEQLADGGPEKSRCGTAREP